VAAAIGAGTSGTTGPLVLSDGSVSAVTLTHNSGDGYTSQTDKTTPDGILLYGEDKSGPAGGGGPPGFTATYTFNNVPAGEYDLIAYTEDQKSNTSANITVGTTTNYIFDQVSSGTPAFQLANNTNPIDRGVGNYVEFFNVAPVGGAITLTNTNEGSNSAAIDGFQLVSVVPEPVGIWVIGVGVGWGMKRRGRRAMRLEHPKQASHSAP
jgi:hypothetical protein